MLTDHAETALPTRYVRVRNHREGRFIEFDFAIGDPCLSVELILPNAAFSAFCAANQVVPMSPEQIRALDAEADKWRYGEDTLMATNHGRHAGPAAVSGRLSHLPE